MHIHIYIYVCILVYMYISVCELAYLCGHSQPLIGPKKSPRRPNGWLLMFCFGCLVDILGTVRGRLCPSKCGDFQFVSYQSEKTFLSVEANLRLFSPLFTFNGAWCPGIRLLGSPMLFPT